MVEGVKANGYNATYDEALFDVIVRDHVYEIREWNSGITFFIDKGAFDDDRKGKKGAKTIKGHDKEHQVYRRRDRTS